MRVPSVLLFGCLLAMSIQARAQPLFAHTESIESTVANADLVFIGRITNFAPLHMKGQPEGHQVGMVIEEILKMELQEGPYERLGIFVPGADSVLKDWLSRSCRLLVAYDETAPFASTVIELAQDKVEVMAADCRLLRDPDAVVQAARETVRHMPRAVKRVHTFRLEVPAKWSSERNGKSTTTPGAIFYCTFPLMRGWRRWHSGISAPQATKSE